MIYAGWGHSPAYAHPVRANYNSLCGTAVQHPGRLGQQQRAAPPISNYAAPGALRGAGLAVPHPEH